MKRSIFKPIIIGILIGTAAFFAPFLVLKAILFFLIIGSIIRMVMWRRYYSGAHRYYLAHTDKIRSMSEEEYTAFKNKAGEWSNNCGRGWKNTNCDNRAPWKNCNNSNDCSSSNNTKENNPGNK